MLEEELLRFIVSRISKTRSPKITLISFGTSGPVVARVVSRPELASVAVKWVAISAPVKACASLSFLKSRRWKSSLELKTNSTRVPHQLAVGERDTVCYPEEVFGKEPDLTIPDVGHYGALLHSSTTQFVLNVLKQ